MISLTRLSNVLDFAWGLGALGVLGVCVLSCNPCKSIVQLLLRDSITYKYKRVNDYAGNTLVCQLSEMLELLRYIPLDVQKPKYG